jgi:hypothetical protein
MSAIKLSKKCTPAWPLLLVLGPRLPRGLGQNFPLGDKHNMVSRELLLQFTDQTGLDLLELLELRHGHVDDDRLLAAELNFLGLGYVQFLQLRLEVRVHLQLQQGLGNLGLKHIGLSAPRFEDFRVGSQHLENKTQNIQY